MNLIKQQLLSLLLLVVGVIAQTSGVVDRDIDFTTYTGKEFNLHDLLNSKKHIYVITYKYPF